MSGYKTSFCSNVISLWLQTLESVLLYHKIKGIFGPFIYLPIFCNVSWVCDTSLLPEVRIGDFFFSFASFCSSV